ncbi:hypothetical protein E2562_023326 [Oryza meyeriana var. granulata]|uniref:DUF674 family protein n=1 Tax=Oryza meyeriana var. granulata TaxID=110450 RepID=A0A6G1E2S9_9ORYZ|nr:hypothetical protein E2562_023326 [Oryza meyeriana var. granulata]
MKLLVDTKAQRVLYAEAGKGVVNFLFSLLTLPVGTVVKDLPKDSKVGSIVNLYASVEELDAIYARSADATNVQPPEPAAPLATKLYRRSLSRFSDCYDYVSTVINLACQLPQCDGKMTLAVKHVVSSSSSSTTGSSGSKAAPVPAPSAVAGPGFVQGVVTYTIMDDLMVAPVFTTTLLKSGVTDIKSLQEKTVQTGYIEGLAMLKASLQSKTVLTDVFIGKKR